MEIPDESDDPEEIVSNIVQEAESLGVSLNITSPLEMLSGNGFAVLELLSGLCDVAAEKKGSFKANKISYPEAEDEQQIVNEESRSRSNSVSESIGSIIDEVETKKKSRRKPYLMKNTGFDSETEDEEEVADLDYVLSREDSNLRKKSKKHGNSTNYSLLRQHNCFIYSIERLKRNNIISNIHEIFLGSHQNFKLAYSKRYLQPSKATQQLTKFNKLNSLSAHYYCTVQFGIGVFTSPSLPGIQKS